MRIRILPMAAAFSLLLASCTDRPTSLDPSGDLPGDLLQPSLSVLDGTQPNGNAHFFWLSPLGATKKGFEGVANGNFYPTVEICPRNTAGDGCAAGPALASFTRDSGEDKHRIKVDDKNEYFVHWHMANFTPARDGVYRIRVLIQGFELGHADVIALRQRDIKAYASQGGELIPVSDQGSFKIAFRMEEGVLEDQFCDFDGDTDVQDCQAQQEIPGDGKPTTVRVTGSSPQGPVVAAVVTAPDGVFKDINGTPIPNVVVTAEVEVDPPSDDVFPDAQEFPFFVEVNTYPGNVYIDPNGPGVTVVVCQDEDELLTRGVAEPLHSQLILYKVSDAGTTRRLVSTFGSPECDGPAPAPAPSGLLGMLKRSTSKVLGALGPEPLVARRRLHGGLNTIITRDVSLGEAFSTFGAALGPNAAQTSAVLPASGVPGTPVPITIQVRNALGENFVMAGDTLEVTVRGANPTATFKATDAGTGIHTASYTPAAPGVDSIDIVLIRADGIGLGPIGGSPYVLQVVAPTQVTNTNDAGIGSLRQAILNANLAPGRDSISFAIPGGGPKTITLTSPLPALTGEAIVDGFSQPGYDGAPYVEVAGTGVTGYGFHVQASNVTLRGLAITGFSADGIFVLQGSTGTIIEDNYVGTDRAGSSGKGNQNAGIRYRGANGAIRGNLISGNTQAGILLEMGAASSNVIEDNTIGLDPAGTTALPNGGNGITMYDGTPNNVIRNNLISGNGGVGIDIQHSGALAAVSGTQILGNTIGLDVNGDLLRRGPADVIDNASFNWGPVDRGNLGGGVRILNAPNTVIGAPGQGNVVSGNKQNGVHVVDMATGVLVQGNLIGTDPSGAANRGNGTINTWDGVRVEGSGPSGVLIGGSGPGQGNVISGNLSDGIGIVGAPSGVTIQGNLVGTDASGTAALGNGVVFTTPDAQGCCHSGIFVDNATNVLIGGATPTAGNVVSGNNTGLWIGGAPGIQIRNNKIGTDGNGGSFLPNTGDGGIALYGTANGVITENLIAGNQALGGIFAASGTQGSLIQDNSFNGNASAAVVLHPSAGVGNTFRGNSMAGNAFGIDLGWNGPTANDGLDADSGPNGLQNFPVLSAAVSDGVGGANVQVDISSHAGTSFELEVFASATCHGGGYGEGVVPVLVTTAPATDGAGNVSFQVNVPGVPAGQVLTGTLTHPDGSTSEFSACVTVAAAPAFTLSSVQPGQAAAGFGQMVTLTGSGFPASPTVQFTQGATTLNGFVFSATASQIVVRLPTSGLSSTPAGVPTGVTVTGGAGASNTLTIPVSTTPGTPVIFQLWEAPWTPAAPPPSNVCGGPATFSDAILQLNAPDAIAVQAYGLDTSGSQVQIVQGGNTWTQTPMCAFSAPSAVVVPLPSAGAPGDLGGALAAGPAQVRVRTQVNGVWSAWSTALNVTLAPPAPVPSWSLTASMANSGLDLASVLLDDGRVLVVGLNTASAQVYNPTSGTWATVSAPFSLGFGIAATKLADGRVLVSGGASGGGSMAAIFNPGSNAFTAVGSLNTGRRYHSQALLPDGRVLVVGGFDGTNHFASLEIFDPGTSIFTLAPVSLSSGRVLPHTATLPSGKVLIAGGSAPTFCALTGDLYDPVAGTLTPVPGSLTSCTHNGGSATLADGRVFMIGTGGTGQLYDPVTNAFSATGSLIEPRHQFAVAPMADGRVMVMGGVSQISGTSIASTEIYNPLTGTFSAGPSMVQHRLDHSANLLLDGRILVMGGVALGGGGILSSAEIYVP